MNKNSTTNQNPQGGNGSKSKAHKISWEAFAAMMLISVLAMGAESVSQMDYGWESWVVPLIGVIFNILLVGLFICLQCKKINLIQILIYLLYSVLMNFGLFHLIF
ncbi:MAG: hypothetical protein PF542_05590 [Nanoarchaeota archaeon]|jgi:uncharacterized integral membrane protein|nr:hypothetical protein [Nanoarchaeota archaeon]